MIPQNFPDWCSNVEKRFVKLEKKIARLEGENVVIIILLGIILTKVLISV